MGDETPGVRVNERGLPITMTVIDYNGVGAWSRDALLTRYAEYIRRFQVSSPIDISPNEHTEGGRRWIYPVMERVIEGIERQDRACIEIGVEFIEQDERFPFGRILKSNTARALRRASIPRELEDRVRRRVADMLISGNVPREFREYARLIRKLGFGDLWAEVESAAPHNAFVAAYMDYFRRFVIGAEPR